MEEFRVDPRVTTPEARAMYIEQGRKLFAFNQTIPFTPENIAATKALFGENLGEGSNDFAGCDSWRECGRSSRGGSDQRCACQCHRRRQSCQTDQDDRITKSSLINKKSHKNLHMWDFFCNVAPNWQNNYDVQRVHSARATSDG